MNYKPKRGDCFRIPHKEGGTRDYTFAKKAGTDLIFAEGTTGRPVPFDHKSFEKMINDRVAIRQVSSNWLDRMDVHAFMDPELEGTSKQTRKKILEVREKVAYAAMLLFYVQRWDKTPEDQKSRGKKGYNKFIDETYSKATANGYFHMPSYSALRRALEKGQPHERDLTDYIPQTGCHNKRPFTDPWVVANLAAAVEEFYSEGIPKPPDMEDVVLTFLGKAILEERSRPPDKRKDFKYPKRTAVREHILAQETKERLAKRDPRKAQAKYGGRAAGASADFPLQRVQLDQTRLDSVINIYDEDGNVVDQKRPWLVSIFDVYSRSILAAILTFDNPSTYTVQLAIKQMLRPKQFLFDRFGFKTGVTDISGQAKEITFDNGVENPGLSMRLLLADAGTDMELAPVGVPQAKSIVERGFHTYNTALWHKAPGGIPYRPHAIPDRKLKPHELAQWALEFATGVMWYWIVKVHQVNRNRTLEAAPGRLWSEKILDPMVGRSVSKRLDLIDIICGTRERLKINGAGVTHEGHTFHHPMVTEDFLRATIPKEGRSARGKVSVEAIIYPHDCSYIYIVDHVLNRYVRLPNDKPRFTQGLSWYEAKLIRESDRRLDRAFISEEELVLAKYEFIKLRDGARAAARAERAIIQAKRAAKKAEREDELVIFTLEEGQHIEMGTIEPTVRGDASYDVEQEMPAVMRTKTLEAHKDEQRNARKARETRETNKAIRELREATQSKPLLTSGPAFAKPESLIAPSLHNADSFLDALEDDLD